MLKSRDSKQVESSTRTTDVLQKLEFDATPLAPQRRITSTQVLDSAVDQEIEDDVEDEIPTQEYIAKNRSRCQIISKPAQLRDHIACALSAMEAEVSSHFEKAVDSLDGDL